MRKFFKEFGEFIKRGNVLDMAVGVIVGGAFTAIVTALSNGILKPFINWIIWLCNGKQEGSVESIYTVLNPVYTDGALDLTKSIYIDWGAFISAIINFLLIAFVVFIIVKTINKASDKLNVNKVMKETIEKKLASGGEMTNAEKRWVKKMEAYHPEFVPESLKPKTEVKEPEPPAKTETEILLTEILAELKKNNQQ